MKQKTGPTSLTGVWDDYYETVPGETVIKDKNFFRMEVEAIVQQVNAKIKKRSKKQYNILELGSGTGFLASRIISEVAGESNAEITYTGVDFSHVAVLKANSRNLPSCDFIESDFTEFLKENRKKYDFVISQRSIMAIMDRIRQGNLLIEIRNCLNKSGSGLFSECTTEALKILVDLRKQLGLTDQFEKVWHSLYLDEKVLDKIYKKVTVIDFSSMYWLITRVVYPHFEVPTHNSTIHDFAAKLTQHGNYGLVKLFLVKP